MRRGQETVISGDFARPDAALLRELAACGVSTLAEATGGSGLLDVSIRPLQPGAVLVGAATTCAVAPGDNLAMHVALQVARPGDVIVIASLGEKKGALWGELVTTSARARGVAGVVVDGNVRDVRVIRHLAFPVWCSGISAQGTTKREVGIVNRTVVCGGVAVEPGDVIVADDDGVLAVRASEVQQIVRLGRQRISKEGAMRERLQAGATPFDLLQLGAVLDRLSVRIEPPHGPDHPGSASLPK